MDVWTLTRSDLLYKEKYAAILAAANTGQQITLVFKPAWLGCGAFNSNSIYYVLVAY